MGFSQNLDWEMGIGSSIYFHIFIDYLIYVVSPTNLLLEVVDLVNLRPLHRECAP